MIQRVQTIWLLLAATAMFFTLKFSFYSGTLLNATLVSKNSFHSLVATDNFILMILTCALGSALIINIFLFKHRILQFRICIIAILLEFLILFLYYRQTKLYTNGTLDIWAIFHLVTIIALILAARGIYKDEKLIKDSNRLR
jgi:glucan phosphoethanolaminetransferase (alkaline phosphatase superfamily)